jgi:DNA-binding SARP family transcriptional activator
VRCLGTFAIEADGVPLDLRGVQPRNQELLRILCLYANRTVHREELMEWLWPGRDPAASGHSLQVAVSALRRVLEPGQARGRWRLLLRDGEGYRLALDPAAVDVRLVDAHLAAARAAWRRGDREGAALAYRQALDHYGGDVLPAEGPADWVVRERERLRAGITEACERLADHAAGGGQHSEVVRLARRGLELDQYQDSLWRRLVDGLREGGNPAAASAAEQDYQELLDALERD